MREIKLRAWEPDTQKMVDVFGINPMVFKVYLSRQQLFGETGDDLLISYLESDDYDYVRLMQYTGLKDKNGVEIYEGDIVEQMMWDDAKYVPEAGIIRWHEPSCGFKWFSLEEDPSDGNNYWLQHAEHEHRRVTGNIYENPELLKAGDA